jgi:hypothetical protein
VRVDSFVEGGFVIQARQGWHGRRGVQPQSVQLQRQHRRERPELLEKPPTVGTRRLDNFPRAHRSHDTTAVVAG